MKSDRTANRQLEEKISKVVLEPKGNVAVLRLNNGVTNAIDTELVSDLSAALQEVAKGFRGMVLAGGTKFFSMGFHLPQLLDLNPSLMTLPGKGIDLGVEKFLPARSQRVFRGDAAVEIEDPAGV